MKDFKLDSFCFLLFCISKLIHPCSVVTLQFNSDGLLLRNYLLLFFLECINYFSFELVGVNFFSLFQCLKVRFL